MVLELLDRWSPVGLLLESEAEIEMSRILESGPGTHAKAVFAQSHGWREALKAVASDANALARSKLIVFPQTSVSQYRADFLVVCASVAPVMKRSALSRFGFFVECDGRIGHACQATSGEQASNDTRTHPPGRPLFSLSRYVVYPIWVKRDPKRMGARCRLRLVPRCRPTRRDRGAGSGRL